MGFSAFPGVGPIKFQKLLKAFGSAKSAWNGSKDDLKRELGQALALKFESFKNKFSIELYSNELKKKKVSYLTPSDKNYPKLLSQIKNPPFVLYFKGDSSILNSDKVIGVVGTRKITSYGEDVTTILTSELVLNGFIIVSGLALGVDAVSHKTALENNGKTIAVLGCGVDCCTPSENQSIYNNIVKDSGVVVSELPLSHPPTRGSFPSRNRIIAGLSMGVLVTEGAEDSGALITADYAFKFNRPVFAVPGPITSTLSKGPYKLISKGAKLVTSGQDILKELQVTSSKLRISPTSPRLRGVKGANKDEDRILRLLENEPLHFDEIVRKTNFDSSKLGSILSLMEVKGLVKSTGGGYFSISN